MLAELMLKGPPAMRKASAEFLLDRAAAPRSEPIGCSRLCFEPVLRTLLAHLGLCKGRPVLAPEAYKALVTALAEAERR